MFYLTFYTRTHKLSHSPPDSSLVSTCLLCQYTGPWTSAPPGPVWHPARKKLWQTLFDSGSTEARQAEMACKFQNQPVTNWAAEESRSKYLWVDNINNDILVSTQFKGLCYSLVHADCLWTRIRYPAWVMNTKNTYNQSIFAPLCCIWQDVGKKTQKPYNVMHSNTITLSARAWKRNRVKFKPLSKCHETHSMIGITKERRVARLLCCLH